MIAIWDTGNELGNIYLMDCSDLSSETLTALLRVSDGFGHIMGTTASVEWTDNHPHCMDPFDYVAWSFARFPEDPTPLPRLFLDECIVPLPVDVLERLIATMIKRERSPATIRTLTGELSRRQRSKVVISDK